MLDIINKIIDEPLKSVPLAGWMLLIFFIIRPLIVLIIYKINTIDFWGVKATSHEHVGGQQSTNYAWYDIAGIVCGAILIFLPSVILHRQSGVKTPPPSDNGPAEPPPAINKIYCPSIGEKLSELSSCIKDGKKTPILWNIFTTWNRYQESGKDNNIFNQGVEEFANHIEQSSNGCLVIRICTLDAFIKKNEDKLKNLDDLKNEKTGEFEQSKIFPFIVKNMQGKQLFHMMHGWPSYWGEKILGAEIVNTVPFGMTAKGVDAWLATVDGEDRRKKMYHAHQLVAFSMGNTGVQMGGWFKKKINDITDFKHVEIKEDPTGKKLPTVTPFKFRISGLGAKVFTALGKKYRNEADVWYKEESEKCNRGNIESEIKKCQDEVEKKYKEESEKYKDINIETLSWPESYIAEVVSKNKVDVDALEWVGPYADTILGIHKLREDKEGKKVPVFPYYYYPGWHSPTGLLEVLINEDYWDRLKKENMDYLQVIISNAAAYSHYFISTQFEIKNKDALNDIMDQGISIEPFPTKVLYKLYKVTEDILKQENDKYTRSVGKPEEHFHFLYESYKTFRDSYSRWDIIADDGYTSSLHHSREIAPYHKKMLETALGGILKKDGDFYHANLGENVIKFLIGKTDFNTGQTDSEKEQDRENKKKIEKIAEILLMNPPSWIVLTGHTDSKPAPEGRNNQEISEKRANSVKYLLAEYGLDISKIRSSGLGESEPAIDPQDPAGKKRLNPRDDRNRRVEMRLQYNPGW